MTRRAPVISREAADRDGCRRATVHYHESTKADERDNGEVFPAALVSVQAWRHPEHNATMMEIKPENGGALTPGRIGASTMLHIWTDDATALLALVLCEETARDSIEVAAVPVEYDPADVGIEDPETRAEMHLAQAKGNPWGWGRLIVRVQALGFVGEASSVVDRAYRDERHVRQPGGLYDKLLRAALIDLESRIRSASKR